MLFRPHCVPRACIVRVLTLVQVLFASTAMAQTLGLASAPRTLTSAPQPTRADYVLQYGDTNEELTKRTFERGRCTLLYSAGVLSADEVASAAREISDAYRLIEPLGRNARELHICVVTEIRPRFAIQEEGLQINGLTFEHGNALMIALRKDRIRCDYLAHELCHLRLTELGFHYSWWLDEGVAECFESWDYVCRDHLETLRTQEVASFKQLQGYKPLQGEEDRIRATAWAIAYHLLVQRRVAFSELEVEALKLDLETVRREVLQVAVAEDDTQ